MAQGENPNAEVAVKELSNRITQLIAATMSDSQHDASVAVGGAVLRTPGLAAELESAVAKWVAQSPISTGTAVPEQWVHLEPTCSFGLTVGV